MNEDNLICEDCREMLFADTNYCGSGYLCDECKETRDKEEEDEKKQHDPSDV